MSTESGLQAGYLYSDDYIPYFKVREAEIIDRMDLQGPVYRLRFKLSDPRVPETVLIFARHPGFDDYLLDGREVSVNIISDVANLPIEEAFWHPSKTLLSIGHFTKEFPTNALSEQPGYVAPEGWE